MFAYVINTSITFASLFRLIFYATEPIFEFDPCYAWQSPFHYVLHSCIMNNKPYYNQDNQFLHFYHSDHIIAVSLRNSFLWFKTIMDWGCIVFCWQSFRICMCQFSHIFPCKLHIRIVCSTLLTGKFEVKCYKFRTLTFKYIIILNRYKFYCKSHKPIVWNMVRKITLLQHIQIWIEKYISLMIESWNNCKLITF